MRATSAAAARAVRQADGDAPGAGSSRWLRGCFWGRRAPMTRTGGAVDDGSLLTTGPGGGGTLDVRGSRLLLFVGAEDGSRRDDGTTAGAAWGRAERPSATLVAVASPLPPLFTSSPPLTSRWLPRKGPDDDYDRLLSAAPPRTARRGGEGGTRQGS
ncbi:hypothetical protein CDD83_4503 [Cordyceps sp. RAO-2017]|nr:hypothetical protein CDD83_4503 [Cordyceps sp. RAO-2017]